MDSQNKVSREINDGESVSAGAKPKLGIIGLILGIAGTVISLGSLLLFFLLLLGGGGLDILDYPTEEFAVVIYCSFFFGIAGGVLGIVSLRRGENETASSVAIVLGTLMFCVCGLLTLFIVIPSFSF